MADNDSGDSNFSLKDLKASSDKKNKEKQDDKLDERLLSEVLSICAVVFGLLIMISQVSKDAGLIGTWINGILQVLFGSGAYLLPIIIIIMAGYIFIKKKSFQRIKIFYLIFIFISFISFLHILQINSEEVKSERFFDMVVMGIDGKGGIIGSFIGSFLISFLGKLGSIMFTVSIMIVFLIMLTGRSFFGTITFIILFVNRKIKEDVFNLFPKNPPDGPSEMFGIDKYDNDEADDEPPKSLLDKIKSTKLVNYVTSYINDDDELYFEETGEDDEEPDEEIREHVAKSVSTFMGFTDNDDDDEEDDNNDFEQSDNVINIPNLFYNPKDSKEIEAKPEPEIVKKQNDDPVEKFVEILDLSVPKNKRTYSDDYRYPSIMLLNKNPATFSKNANQQAEETKNKLQSIFNEFKVDAKVNKYYKGPTVTRYEISPGEGVKVSRISGLSDEIALNLASPGIRIEAPIPGKAAVGIEIPNKEAQAVFLREVIGSKEFATSASKLSFAVGKDIEGNVIISDIKEMPHLLIAGATGSGKSVCINTLIISIIYKAKPEEVKLLMIDPKVVELSVYNGIPHLMIPVVTDPKKAAGALSWAVREMTERYNKFSLAGVRGLEGYNEHKKEIGEEDFLPQIVVIIDELSDLMQTSSSEVEENIKRLSQMARAAGIYLIIATQRPSVDVITGVIKANIPSRLAFAVSSGTDSRTILDMMGAEKLLGRGDMLFYPKGVSKPIRVQGAFISDKEVEKVVNFVKSQNKAEYSLKMIEEITATSTIEKLNSDVDEFFEDAIEFVVLKEKASASSLQRQFRVGYNRASRMMDDLEARGIIGKEEGSKPRKVLMTITAFEEYKRNKK